MLAIEGMEIYNEGWYEHFTQLQNWVDFVQIVVFLVYGIQAMVRDAAPEPKISMEIGPVDR